MSTPEKSPPQIRLLLVDDHELVRLGLRWVLRDSSAYAVIAEASTIAEALQYAIDVRPDVVVMDIELPDGSGLRATRALRRALPNIGIVILTVDDGRAHLLDALYAGASGYVSMSSPAADVLTAIRHAAEMPLAFAAAGLASAVRQRLETPPGAV
ncbi:MAG TPA: response regulator transcription factor [Micromonosporaceae bacterium]|jgi:DNA-binding NarL/FixJ family response regulator